MHPVERQIWQNAFLVCLDPEGPNGHHLFANSQVNGPVMDALVEEFIPELEATFSLRKEPAARMLTGHSSGGWSALWLTLNRPDLFGACWASAPDPVDFRAFQFSNLYESDNLYLSPDPDDPGGTIETPSRRAEFEVLMSVRDENLMEEVVGPGNSSGLQWDSWQAVFGPRTGSGLPAPLFDAETGAVDGAVLKEWSAYDIGRLFRSDPDRYAPLLRDRVRVIVGGLDDFYLDRAVRLLADDLAGHAPRFDMEQKPGFLVLLDWGGHADIIETDVRTRFPADMVRHMRRHYMIPRQARPR